MEDRQLKHLEASEERKEIQTETVKVIENAKISILQEGHTEFQNASNEREEALTKTLEVMEEIRTETTTAIKEGTEEIKEQLVDLQSNINNTRSEIIITKKIVDKRDKQFSSSIEKIEKKLKEDDKVNIKFNKKAYKEHPDVKNVDKALRKIGDIKDSGEVMKLRRETQRIGEDLKSAEKSVRKFFKKL